MESNDQKKLRPEEKQIRMSALTTKNGPEVTVIARDSFFGIDANGKCILTTEPDTKTFSIKLQEDDTIITFDRKKIQSIYNDKIISTEIYKTLIDILNDQIKLMNPTADSAIKHAHIEEAILKLPRQMEAVRTLLASIKLLDIEKQKFFLKDNHINTEISFGVNKVVMDRLYYLPELIKGCKLIKPKPGADTYKVVSNYTSKTMGAIGLEHTLRLSEKHRQKARRSF